MESSWRRLGYVTREGQDDFTIKDQKDVFLESVSHYA